MEDTQVHFRAETAASPIITRVEGDDINSAVVTLLESHCTASRLASLRERAMRGDRDAQRDLGCAYIWGEELWGDLLRKDETQARHWYILAADRGHDEAMGDVWSMCLNGDGGPPDIERALRYLRVLAGRRRWTPWSADAAGLLATFHQDGLYGLQPDESIIARYLLIVRDMRRKERGARRRGYR